MPAGEFADWMRYSNTEPFGFPREETRFSIIAANTLAASSNKFDSLQITRPDHWFYRPPKNLSNTESIEMMKSMLPMARRRKRVPIGY